MRQFFFHCDTNALISLILLLTQIIVMIHGKHFQATHQKIDSLL